MKKVLQFTIKCTLKICNNKLANCVIAFNNLKLKKIYKVKNLMFDFKEERVKIIISKITFILVYIYLDICICIVEYYMLM